MSEIINARIRVGVIKQYGYSNFYYTIAGAGPRPGISLIAHLYRLNRRFPGCEIRFPAPVLPAPDGRGDGHSAIHSRPVANPVNSRPDRPVLRSCRSSPMVGCGRAAV